jgi:DNA-binding FadR family transcriptional regulator
MNFPEIEPLAVKSLKEVCIARLESLILSGQLQIGERLPSERDLAVKLGVSRPVLHEAIVDLSNKGLVNIQPRRGVYISDYRVTGSFALLSSLLSYHQGGLDRDFQRSLMDMRRVLETETARLAALNGSPEQIEQLRRNIELERISKAESVEALTGSDFDFHLQVALASHNLIYPLIMNSFKPVYTNLTGQFFAYLSRTSGLEELFTRHKQLVDAIESHQPENAARIMHDMLEQGERFFLDHTD